MMRLLLLAALIFSPLIFCAEPPVVFWISDPLQPDETALVSGARFDPQASVEIARLDDGAVTAPDFATKLNVAGCTALPVLQAGAESLKFVLPAAQKAGVFSCRVKTAGGVSQPRIINAPEVWWSLGDSGDSATAGGWMRFLGKNLTVGGKGFVFLKPGAGEGKLLESAGADVYSAQVKFADDFPAGEYAAFVHSGLGGNAGWVAAGTVQVRAAEKWPQTRFDVMDFYGKDRETEIQKTLRRGSLAPDRTEAVQAALKKAQENGGGVVYFPAGMYGIQAELKIPPRTVLKGEGMNLAILWWGKGAFALDGGGSQDRKEGAPEGFSGRMIFGENFGIEDLSLYVPLACNNAIQTGNNFRMQRVRVRVDRYWLRTPQRQNGTFLRVGNNFSITDCDIIAKASAVSLGTNGVLARNKIQAGKCNCEMGHAANVVIEDNAFVSLDPTAYINVYEEGRNFYYARNTHESFYADQSDYSFTFDGPGGAYLGKIAACDGVTVTLAEDPKYLKWADEKSKLWKKSVIAILSGTGAGQYRFVTANAGREWKVDRAFDVAPDSKSTVTIAPFRGHAAVVGNRFEDANWVNMGYGSSFDIICADNKIVRSAQLLNYGLKLENGHQPSWYVQYLNNEVSEGHTDIETSCTLKSPAGYDGTLTRYAIHRGTHLKADNSGRIRIGGNAADVIVEHCKLDHPSGTISNDKESSGVLFRDNEFSGGAPRYKVNGALVIPAP